LNTDKIYNLQQSNNDFGAETSFKNLKNREHAMGADDDIPKLRSFAKCLDLEACQ